MNIKNTETLRSPWQKEGRRMRNKGTVSAKEKIFLLVVEGPTHPSLGGTFLSTSSSRFFYQRLTTKNTK